MASSAVSKRSGPKGSTSEDRTGLDPLSGKLQKLSTKGRWQTRFFRVRVGARA